MRVPFQRGTNVSHWLSQSNARGVRRRAYFQERDVRRIADWGFDHIRLPIDEEQMWNAAGQQSGEAFELLDAAIDWAMAAGLGVIVDLHILRSHFFNQEAEAALFSDSKESEKFAQLWRELSARLRNRPHGRVAYELMNEPVARNPEDWNRVARQALAAVRESEPERWVVLGSNGWNSALTFDQLEIPDDRHLILTFHYYRPMLVTHHQARWCPEGRLYAGPIQYPGRPIPEEFLHLVSDPGEKRLAEWNRPHDRSEMVADLAQPLAASIRTGLPLYCGEFGVIDRAPHTVRLAWYRDLISVFSQFGIGWANWDYKEEFGIFDGAGQGTGILEAMFSRYRMPRAAASAGACK